MTANTDVPMVEALHWVVQEKDAEIERLHEQVQDMIDASGQQCGCGYDKPDDVCLGHWPAYKKQQDEIERLRELVESAYRDGWLDGSVRDPFGNVGPSDDWERSDAKVALTATETNP